MKTPNQTPNRQTFSSFQSQTFSRKVLAACLALTATVALAPSLRAATTLTIEPDGGTLFPSTAEVIAATPSDPGLFGDSASISLAQSVLSPGFDLKTVYIRYYTLSTATIEPTIDLNIFTVADVNAATHAEPPPGAGSLLLTESVTFPLTGGGASNYIAAIELDVPLTLAASAGTDGYAIHFATSGNSDFRWYRTGATAGSVYAGGEAYEDGTEKGARDFVLALSSLPVPEPTTAALLSLGFLSLLGRFASRRAG